jgi:hypothetical protein
VAQGEGPEFKPQYRKKKKKNLPREGEEQLSLRVGMSGTQVLWVAGGLEKKPLADSAMSYHVGLQTPEQPAATTGW